MLYSLIFFFQHHLLPLGGLGVFIATVLEETIAPVPSIIVILASGFFLVSGPINPHSVSMLVSRVAFPAALGITLGSLFAYSIAFFAGKPFFEKWGKWIGFSWQDVEKFQARFSKTSFDEVSLFAARAIPIVPSVIVSVLCGIIRLPLRAYLMYSFLGLFVRAMFLGFIGWQIGKLYFHYSKILVRFEGYILIGVLICLAMFLVWRFFVSKNKVQGPMQ